MKRVSSFMVKKLHRYILFNFFLAKCFVSTYQNPEVDIRNRLSIERKKQVTENRSRLIPILKTIILHGQQNIPLRGHRDDGALLDDSGGFNIVENNDGCFRALLRFRIDAGDNELKEHLKNARSNATYISKTTANQLIKCCEEEILCDITKKINSSDYYSIIFDETTDVSNVSQLSISIRYVHEKKIYESFMGFLDLHDTNYEGSVTNEAVEPVITGEILGQSVINKIRLFGLNLEKCIGIGCDGCSVNMSKVKGAAVEIQKVAKNAIICPCFNHALNLSISKSLTIRSVKNTMGIIQEIVSFFQSSAKRNFILKKYLKHKLSSPCQTRWIERHDSILEFQGDLPLIEQALREISDWNDNFSSSKANLFLKAICDCEFILTIFCLADIFALTLPFSKYLQTVNIDVEGASSKLTTLLQVLQEKRTNIDTCFQSILTDALRVMEKLGIELKKPRLVSRQSHRDSFSDSANLTPENYWKRVIFIPVLDSVIFDLKARFPKNTINVFLLNLVIPTNIKRNDPETLPLQVGEITQKFGQLLGNPSSTQLLGEIQLYYRSILKNAADSDSAIEALDSVDSAYFPNVANILQILATLPVSVATAERSFSTLRLLKTYLRSTMTQDRLNGLALLYVYKNKAIDLHKIIDRFANKKRRIDFVI